ncbi:hypothetical protein JCM19038_112 [Geomicrobium sp. JCM 19038]|nr:hypothetical protein JCM19038_112 [Geomicrobium sp. JCM 19038]
MSEQEFDNSKVTFFRRTDLAVEDENVLPNRHRDGIHVEEHEEDEITITNVTIDEKAAEMTGKQADGI